MTRLTLSLAVLSIAVFAYETSAEPPGKKGGRERGAAADGQRKSRDGERGGAPTNRDPRQMVVKMIQEFDTDGDEKLNATELAAMLTSMRERRGGQGGQGGEGMRSGGQGRRPGQGAAGAGDQRRRGGPGAAKRGGEAPGTAGGERPKRPGAEQ